MTVERGGRRNSETEGNRAKESPLFKASAFAFRSFPLLIRLPSAFAPLGNKRHHHHHHHHRRALLKEGTGGSSSVAL